MKRIYVVIVTYNAMRRKWIDRCLVSLRDSTIKTLPIVVDNCSIDGTREYVPMQYPDVIWLPQEKNVGFGRGNNVGIRYALAHDADYVLLLNQDVSLHPRALEFMLKVCDGKSLLSPLHLNGRGDAFDNNFRKYSLPSNVIIEDLLLHNTMKDVYETGEICAACWLLPVNVIKKIGGFNPVFFQYGEDNNYYNRMVYHGVKTLLVPKAKMFHDRVCQGNEKVFNKKQLRRKLVVVAYDINRSFMACVREYLWQLVSCYRHRLLKGKYIPGIFTYETIRIIASIRDILVSRREEKKETMNWL